MIERALPVRFERLRPQDRLGGIYKGTCVWNDDPRALGRIKIRCYELWGDTEVSPDEELPWALPCFPPGFFNVPAVGDTVWFMFEMEHTEHPVYLGIGFGVTNGVPAQIGGFTGQSGDYLGQKGRMPDKQNPVPLESGQGSIPTPSDQFPHEPPGWQHPLPPGWQGPPILQQSQEAKVQHDQEMINAGALPRTIKLQDIEDVPPVIGGPPINDVRSFLGSPRNWRRRRIYRPNFEASNDYTYIQDPYTNEVPEDVLRHQTRMPDVKEYKSEMGHTFVWSDEHGGEVLKVIDRVGQELVFVCALNPEFDRNNQYYRADREAIAGTAINPDFARSGTFAVYLYDARSEGFRAEAGISGSLVEIFDYIGQTFQLLHTRGISHLLALGLVGQLHINNIANYVHLDHFIGQYFRMEADGTVHMKDVADDFIIMKGGKITIINATGDFIELVDGVITIQAAREINLNAPIININGHTININGDDSINLS